MISTKLRFCANSLIINRSVVSRAISTSNMVQIKVSTGVIKNLASGYIIFRAEM